MNSTFTKIVLRKPVRRMDALYGNAQQTLSRTGEFLQAGTEIEIGEKKIMKFGGKEMLAVPYRLEKKTGYLLDHEM